MCLFSYRASDLSGLRNTVHLGADRGCRFEGARMERDHRKTVRKRIVHIASDALTLCLSDHLLSERVRPMVLSFGPRHALLCLFASAP